MDEQALSRLRDLDWKEISANVLRAAIHYAARYGWTVASSLPKGQSLQGLVQQSVAEIWETPDRLNPDVPLHVQLAGIVRSKLSNLAKCKDDDVVRSGNLAHVPADSTDDKLRNEELFKRAMQLLLNSPKVKGHDDKELVVLAMSDGKLNVSEVADATGLEKTRIYQINRELCAIYPSIAEMLQREEDGI